MTETGTRDVATASAAALGPRQRRTLVGLLTVVTAVAFEALAVATVMPVVARELSGLRLYGWAFTGYFIPSIVGMVVAGRWSDRAGPVPAFLSGLGLFGAGLLIAGSASSMPMFIAGRAVQGFGGGENIVALYVVIARVYAEDQRPRVFSAISAAWVLPAVVGPAVAGFVAQHLGWRWVFFGLPPFVVLGLALLVPGLRSIGAATSSPADDGQRQGWLTAVALAAGVTAVELAGQRWRWWSVPLAVAGLGLLVPALRRLLPDGALRLARGLPAVIVCRGLLAGGFFGAEAFVPLVLQTVHRLSPSLAGLPLTLGAIGWFAGSWYQGRLPADRPRAPLVRRGFGIVAVGVAALVSVTFPAVSPWVAVACWAVAGTGMGIAMATVGLLMLQYSPPHEQGANSASLQIADAVGTTLCVGAGGVLLAVVTSAGGSTGSAVRIIFAAMAGVAAVGFLAGGRASASD